MRDDEEPTGEEAQAQSQETVMPLVWGGLALVLVIGFIVAFAVGTNYSGGAPHAVVAPSEAPATPLR